MALQHQHALVLELRHQARDGQAPHTGTDDDEIKVPRVGSHATSILGQEPTQCAENTGCGSSAALLHDEGSLRAVPATTRRSDDRPEHGRLSPASTRIRQGIASTFRASPPGCGRTPCRRNSRPGWISTDHRQDGSEFGDYALGASVTVNFHKWIGAEGDIGGGSGIRQDLTFNAATLTHQKSRTCSGTAGIWWCTRSVTIGWSCPTSPVGSVTQYRTIKRVSLIRHRSCALPWQSRLIADIPSTEREVPDGKN